MGNRLSFAAEGTHEAEILQSPSTKDEVKAAGDYISLRFNSFAYFLTLPKHFGEQSLLYTLVRFVRDCTKTVNGLDLVW